MSYMSKAHIQVCLYSTQYTLSDQHIVAFTLASSVLRSHTAPFVRSFCGRSRYIYFVTWILLLLYVGMWIYVAARECRSVCLSGREKKDESL